MSLFLLVIGTGIITEIVYRLRHKYRQVGNNIITTASTAISTIRSPTIPDSSKEKLLPQYAVELFVQSLILFGLLLLTVFPLVIITVLNSLKGGNFLQFMLAPGGILLSTLVAAAYLVVRRLVTNG
jgi:hypothetical protein